MSVLLCFGGYMSGKLGKTIGDDMIALYKKLEKAEARIEALENTLLTTVSWLGREFGEHGVKQLFEMLKRGKET